MSRPCKVRVGCGRQPTPSLFVWFVVKIFFGHGLISVIFKWNYRSQQIRKAILHCPAVLPKELSIAREQDAIQVGIPPEMTAGVLELTF